MLDARFDSLQVRHPTWEVAEGAGKSTFLQFVMKYALCHYEFLRNYGSIIGSASAVV